MTGRALVVLALLPFAANADDRPPSHGSIGRSSQQELTALEFAKRDYELQLSKLLSAIRSGKIDELQALKIGEDLKRSNPGLLKFLRGFEGDEKEWQTFIEQFAKQHPDLRRLPPEMIDQQIKNALRKLTANQFNADLPFSDSGDRFAKDLTEQELASQRANFERFHDLLRKFDLGGKLGSMGDSKAVQDMIEKLAKGGQSTASPLTPGNVAGVLDMVDAVASRVKDYLPASMPGLPQFKVRAPDLGNGWSFGNSISSGPELPENTLPILAIIAVAVSALFVWRVSAQSKKRARLKRPQVYELVDPERVSTREDLIQAFEHLALWFFGDAAAHWHHRYVAERLAKETSDRADAEAVAALYERARYAPAATNIDWQSAREPLRRLARRQP